MLLDSLYNRQKMNIYPFHMPGHKGRELELLNPYKMDITEISGFDDLHDPKGLIKDLEDRIAKLYRCKDSYLLVNGSTVGILTLVFAYTKPGDRVLIARNCHQSVFHAAALRMLDTTYIFPEVGEYNISEPISPKSIKKALDSYPDIKLVVVTSPTYEGICSDIKEIAKIVHSYKAALIVDSAHGAHLGFSNYFPPAVLDEGADACVVSLHKTLPFFTQTAAILIRNEDVITNEQIREYLRYFETSSPSYVLMGAADRGLKLIEDSGDILFEKLEDNLDGFYHKIKKDINISLINKKYHDRSKIIIPATNIEGGGIALKRRLLEEYKIELEMSSFDYVIALSSIMDTEDGFNRLSDALTQIYKKTKNNTDNNKNGHIFPDTVDVKLKIHEATNREWEWAEYREATKRISAGMIGLYPPGTALILPGEIIQFEHISVIEEAIKKGYDVRGINNTLVRVVKK